MSVQTSLHTRLITWRVWGFGLVSWSLSSPDSPPVDICACCVQITLWIPERVDSFARFATHTITAVTARCLTEDWNRVSSGLWMSLFRCLFNNASNIPDHMTSLVGRLVDAKFERTLWGKSWLSRLSATLFACRDKDKPRWILRQRRFLWIFKSSVFRTEI